MKKTYVLPPNENWIVDRFVKEWCEDNQEINARTPHEADVIWLLSDWCWRQIHPSILASKKVLTTVHHIVPQKFGAAEVNEFIERDFLTDAYHVYNDQTLNFIRQLTNKPIHLVPYWANQKIWKRTGEKFGLRAKYKIPSDSFVVGSFQRDTEGKDLITPKLEKGPDLLADYVIKKNEMLNGNLHVVLGGWRRQYIINRLNVAGVKYTYLERPDHNTINELYQTLDIYPVTARCEGGPQSLIECGLLDVPVVSRNVGIASQVLPKEAINDDVLHATPAIPNVDAWKLPGGYAGFRDLLERI